MPKTSFKVVHLIEILDKNFRIPDYQRGYRWDRKQVFDLLNDLKEFYQEKKEKEFYCLQPLVVVDSGLKDPGGKVIYDVIDGQQRLTTIYLLLTYLEDVRKINYRNEDNLRRSAMYQLSFQTRDVHFLIEKKFKNEQEEDALKTNIDYFYMTCAYKAIDEWFANEKDVRTTDILNLLLPAEYFIDDNFDINGDDELNKYVSDVRFLWYDVTQSEGLGESIKIFRRINYGKTPLTATELIKALLFQTDKCENPEYKNALGIGRSYEWDEYEKALQNPLLWGMLTAGNDNSASHMKFLLDYVCRELVDRKAAEKSDLYSKIKLNDDDADYRIVNTYLNFMSESEVREYIRKRNQDKITYKNKCREERISDLWKTIQGTYTTFVNWFQDNKWYHYIGLIISLNKRKQVNFDHAKELQSIYKAYNAKTKNAFELYLKAKIGSLIKIKDDERLDKISYDDGNQSDEIINILLAFNVYHTIVSSREENRFNFALFNELNITSLEHIHPQHLDEENLKRDDVKKWMDIRKASVQSMKMGSEEELSQFKEFFDELGLYLADDSVFKENNEQISHILGELDKKFDDLAGMKDDEMHTLRNMALLTVKDNAAVSNNNIAVKREMLCKRERDGQTYALIGTKYAYNKRFTDPNASTIPSLWMNEDREGYYKAVEEVYYFFINAIKEYEESLK